MNNKEEKEADVKTGVVILAAGKGTRMKTGMAKVLNLLNKKPLLSYVMKTAKSIRPEKIVLIVGHERGKVMELFENDPDIEFAIQEPQLGTGHALARAEPSFDKFEGLIVTLAGDVPFLKSETVKNMIDTHIKTGAAITVLTCRMDDPGSYGRIIRSGEKITGNVEAKDATEEQLAIKEINSGIYVFDGGFLFEALKSIDNRNTQGEYYLTDLISIAAEKGLTVSGVTAPSVAEITGVNTAEELENLEKALQSGAGE